MFESYSVGTMEQLQGLSKSLCCISYTMIVVDKRESTEVHLKSKETSLDKFGSCRHEITMVSSRMEADG